MTPSNKLEQENEDSSSSGASFLQSLNQLSTAKDSDSREMSDISSIQERKSAETSEDSESDHSESAKSPPSDRKVTDNPVSTSKEAEPSPIEDSTKVPQSFQQDRVSSKGKDLADDVTSPRAFPNVSNQAVGSPPTTAMESMSAVEAKGPPSLYVSITRSDSDRPAPSAFPRATDSAEARQHSGTSSEHSVAHTIGSSSTTTSPLSENASLLPMAVPVPKTATVVVDIALRIEAKAPVGHVHLKGKKDPSNVSSQQASLSQFRRWDVPSNQVTPPAPVGSMSGAPMINLTGPVKSKSSSLLRRGKWTVEEEAYVARVIQDFNSGFLNTPAGTTLRSYLSEKLHCDPMRITKKFTGDSCIGKRVFHPAVRCASTAAAIDKAQAELDALERRWRRRLEMQQRESAKKAAASAAAAVAAATGRHGHIPPASVGSAGITPSQAIPAPSSGDEVQQTAVTRTASWLDRANAILSSNDDASQAVPPRMVPSVVSTGRSRGGAVDSLPQQEIEIQMKEVQRLIHEGPIIQQTTAGLPHLLEQQGVEPRGGQRRVTEDRLQESPGPPVDKRPRTSSGGQNSSGAEDAEALVGFLNSVRANAEASGNSN